MRIRVSILATICGLTLGGCLAIIYNMTEVATACFAGMAGIASRLAESEEKQPGSTAGNHTRIDS